jgi:ABC-2 type transport system permease protein
MAKQYSQVKGMLAIAKGSLRAIFRSPSAVIFSFVFPLIFILVFGFLGNGSKLSVKIAFEPKSDTTSSVYQILKDLPGINVVNKPIAELNEDLEKGRLTAILNIQKNPGSISPESIIKLRSSEAVNPQNISILQSIINGLISSLDKNQNANIPTVAIIDPEIKKVKGRTYRTIDFILPGQLGFSLLSAGVFGVAFVFFNLRNTLVLKRFFATPISRAYILLGEGLSRVLFQMITSVVILGVGYFFFQFTLVNGWITFFELLVLSFVGLVVFMGFGFIVSGLAKNESTIPPFANLITLPQFLLAGTFFPIDNFPSWMQPFCRILPLTFLNDSMRNVAFEGAHLIDCGKQLTALGIWTLIVYVIAIKVFKWE